MADPIIVDRDVFLRNLRMSKLLTSQQFRVVIDKLSDVEEPREIAKALVSWNFLTKFHAKMLLQGKSSGFFIGPYRIMELLGQGGMGRVYKAVHQTMNRVVALKVLSAQVVNSERAKELFLREAQATAQLAHPNIVMAFDANEVSGRHYLAMEYVDGPNLDQYVKKHGPLHPGLACEIVFQVANGLQHAFEKGMVHRDIKPANLLLQQANNSVTVQVKILDFGLARLNIADGATEDTILTKQNTVMGTPDFLSPEQSRSLHDLDIRADLYSLGCTFYFLLTGRVPFPGGSTIDKVRHHNNSEPMPIDELRSDLHRSIVKIVRRLMAKNPAHRYQTPDELMEALAPHAAPSVMDWPMVAPRTTNDAGTDDYPALVDQAFDTEPKAQAPTQVTNEQSLLDWVDEQGQQRRRWVRSLVIGSVGVLLGITLTVGLAALLLWNQ